MRLGGLQARTFIAGIAGVSVTGGSAVVINNAGQMGIVLSSRRYKSDIQPMGAHSRGLSQLRPVIFRYKDDAQGERQYGLIAEDVAHVYPELVTRGVSGEVEAVRYHEVIPMLLNPTATLLEHASLTQGFMGTSKSAFPRRLRPQNRESTWANLGNALKCRCRVTGVQPHPAIGPSVPPSSEPTTPREQRSHDKVHAVLLGYACAGRLWYHAF
jgi:Chaperone of endosialidase